MRDHFFFIVERCDRDHRAEDLFAICAARDRQTSDHCGLEEITITATLVDRFRRFTTKRDLPALFLRKVDIELDFIELVLACDRTLLRFLIERITHFQLRCLLDEALDEIVVCGPLDKHTRPAQANLPLVGERRTYAS